MYDSGLEGISSDGDDSGSEDELDLHEDIPVTGFAVASNKRNADFHELFSSIPEGDYLIEGMFGCALGMGSLINCVCRLWMCAAARNSDTRPDLYLGEPYMLSR
jgi:hypothetical protein